MGVGISFALTITDRSQSIPGGNYHSVHRNCRFSNCINKLSSWAWRAFLERCIDKKRTDFGNMSDLQNFLAII